MFVKFHVFLMSVFNVQSMINNYTLPSLTRVAVFDEPHGEFSIKRIIVAALVVRPQHFQVWCDVREENYTHVSYANEEK